MPSRPREPKSPFRPRRAKPREPETLADFFGPDGPLASALDRYEARPEQSEVAAAIERAMEDGKPCLAEAGTGVGKTMAYLIPVIRAALNGKRTVISTHTINLQNQLMLKDIPLVLSLFPGASEKITPVLMKGRGNFLCKQNLENAKNDLFLTMDPQFERIKRWANDKQCSGDLADLPFTFGSWSEIASTPETCRAKECFYYTDCYYYRMRFAAADSKLIVVNHALFFSDLAVRMHDPNSGVIPAYDHVVFDEAHHLEDVATKSFGIAIGSRTIPSLIERIKHVRGLDLDRTRLDAIEGLNGVLFQGFVQPGRAEYYFDEVLVDDRRAAAERCTSDLCNSISALENELQAVAKDDEALKDRLEGLSLLCGRIREELSRLMFEEDPDSIRWVAAMPQGRSNPSTPTVTQSGQDLTALALRQSRPNPSVLGVPQSGPNSSSPSAPQVSLNVPPAGQPGSPDVPAPAMPNSGPKSSAAVGQAPHSGPATVPPQPNGSSSAPSLTLHLTPISVARPLTDALWTRSRSGAVVLVSATLANSGGYSYQRQRLGIPEDSVECLVGSPFNFKSQAMLYVPAHLPAPASTPAYGDLIVAEIDRLIRLTEGRAFILFTSRAMMNRVHELLSARNLPFPLFKQGDLPPGKLIEAFRYSGNGCLLGVQTFWEGVDIQGDALSCVIIDKLPFAVPDSPITKARISAVEQEGGDSFRDYSIPQAQIRLKQGFGRLIRTKDDRGIVSILDSRLLTRGYGPEFVRYLPPAARASKWGRVEKFWQAAEANGDAAASEGPVGNEANADAEPAETR